MYTKKSHVIVHMSSQIQVVIDTREEKLLTALRSDYLSKECGHMTFEVNSLDVGDVIYRSGEQIRCLIERKTMEDYASSIVDKRSKNQVMRINQLCTEHPEMLVIYLIEGDFLTKDQKFRGGVTRDILYSSAINKVVRDHYIIYRTRDINDTALVVTKLYDKLGQFPTSSASPASSASSASTSQTVEYLKTIKVAKKENMTPENCFMCQLSQIPGVSIEIAQIISHQYPLMRHLIQAYDHTDLSSREMMLAEMMIKNRRLGPVLSKRIYEYIYGDVTPVTSVSPVPPVSIKKVAIRLKKI